MTEQPTRSQNDSKDCEKMNLKAKKALKARDFATSASILNELMAYCNIRSLGYWISPLQTNLKILENAKKASQDPRGLSEQKYTRIMKKWKNYAAIPEKTIPHPDISSKIKQRARLFAIAGTGCGFFIGRQSPRGLPLRYYRGNFIIPFSDRDDIQRELPPLQYVLGGSHHCQFRGHRVSH